MPKIDETRVPRLAGKGAAEIVAILQGVISTIGRIIIDFISPIRTRG